MSRFNLVWQKCWKLIHKKYIHFIGYSLKLEENGEKFAQKLNFVSALTFFVEGYFSGY